MANDFKDEYGKGTATHESFYLLNKAGHLDFEVLEDCYYGRRDLRDVLESLFHLYKCDECFESMALIKLIDKMNLEPPKKLSPRLEEYLKNQ